MRRRPTLVRRPAGTAKVDAFPPPSTSLILPPIVRLLLQYFVVGMLMIVRVSASRRSATATAAASTARVPPFHRGRRSGPSTARATAAAAAAAFVPPSAAGPRSTRPRPLYGLPRKSKTRGGDGRRGRRNLASSLSSGFNDAEATRTQTTLESSSQAKMWEELNFDMRVDLLESEYTQVIYRDEVPCAVQLRSSYDSMFEDPREPPSDTTNPRFAWDPWFVRCSDGRRKRRGGEGGDDGVNNVAAVQMIPGEREATVRQTQYSLKRAMCHDIFRRRGGDDDDDDGNHLLSTLLDDLTSLGRSIGCAGITPPWISMYCSGDSQNFHTDPTHGPMAWTLSLTRDEDYNVAFTGGETVLLRPDVLEYWRDFDYGAGGRELGGLCRVLPPTFGRCVAFDPRVPHAVNPVIGTTDPRTCRVMIHGWFARPEPTWFGDLAAPDADADADGDGDGDDGAAGREDCVLALEEALGPLLDEDGPLGGGGDVGRVIGFLAVRLDVTPDGTVVDGPYAVCDTLVADPADFGGVVGRDGEGNDVLEDAPADVRLAVREALADVSFPATEGGGSVVVPFEFV